MGADHTDGDEVGPADTSVLPALDPLTSTSGRHRAIDPDDPGFFEAPSEKAWGRTFKHEVRKVRPRYWFWLTIIWTMGLIVTCANFYATFAYAVVHDRAFEPGLWDWRALTIAALGLLVLFLATALWAAWEREEAYPGLLPVKEYRRRYPPSSAAPPTPFEPGLIRTAADLPALPDGPAPGALGPAPTRRLSVVLGSDLPRGGFPYGQLEDLKYGVSWPDDTR